VVARGGHGACRGRHKACPYGAGTPSGNDNPVGATLVVALSPWLPYIGAGTGACPYGAGTGPAG